MLLDLIDGPEREATLNAMLAVRGWPPLSSLSHLPTRTHTLSRVPYPQVAEPSSFLAILNKRLHPTSVVLTVRILVEMSITKPTFFSRLMQFSADNCSGCV